MLSGTEQEEATTCIS